MPLPSLKHTACITAVLTLLAILSFPLPAFATVTNGMNASYVLGQPDFTSSTHVTTQSGMYGPDTGVTYDTAHHHLFVADSRNNRVLVFDLSAGITNGMNASYVLGQPDFTSSTGATTQSGMIYPASTTYDSAHDRLFVSDGGNTRVLVFDLSAGITNGMNASYVLGQPDFTSSTAATTQSGMNYPYGTAYDAAHNLLFVTDDGVSRVTVYDLSSGISNGMNASYVLGQPDFTSSTAATTQSGMYGPEGPAYDAVHHRLFVTDYGSSRVTVYDLSAGISNGMNAAYVLGQPDFTSSTAATTQSGMRQPEAVEYDAAYDRLFVADVNNYRVTVYDLSSGISNGMNASYVLGQPDFTSSAQATTQSGMSYGYGVGFDPDTARLFVLDAGNSRVLVFDVCPTDSCVAASSSSSSSSSSSPSSSSSAAPQQHSGGHRGHGTDLTEALVMNAEQQHSSSSAHPAAQSPSSSSSSVSASPKTLRALLTELRKTVASCHPRTSSCNQQIHSLRSQIQQMRRSLRKNG